MNKHGLRAAVIWIVVAPVRAYQWAISPWLGARCRFQPTCSQYFVDAVHKYGIAKGTLRGLWRICRCHPFSRGGYDPP